MNINTEVKIGLLSFATDKFARKHNLSVETKLDGYWESFSAPSLLLRWETETGIHCMMNVMTHLNDHSKLYSKKWKFWLGAWKDKEDGRYGKSIMLKENITFMELADSINALLTEGYTILTNLKEEELELIPGIEPERK